MQLVENFIPILSATLAEAYKDFPELVPTIIPRLGAILQNKPWDETSQNESLKVLYNKEQPTIGDLNKFYSKFFGETIFTEQFSLELLENGRKFWDSQHSDA